MQNRASDEIAEAKRAGDDAEPLIAEMREVSAELKELEAELVEVESKRDELARDPAQPPRPRGPGRRHRGGRRDAPRGRRATRASTSRSATTSSSGLANGWIEMEKAAEASGSRFAYLLGDLVMVELALVRFAARPAAGPRA